MDQGDLTVVRHQSGVLVSTLPQAFQETAALLPDSVAIRTVGNAVVITWRQYADRVRKIATGLSALGVERGHTVGLMLRNRPEFHLTDTAVMHLGAIPFSIYNTSAPDQIRYLFSNAENKVVVTEKDFLPAVKAAGADLAHVIVVDADVDGCLTLEHLESLGAKADFDFDSAWRAVRPDDVATLIYTSGTTGPPKGVELTHANLMAAFSAIVDLLEHGTERPNHVLPAARAHRRPGHLALRQHRPGHAGDRRRRPQGDRGGAARCSPHDVPRGAARVEQDQSRDRNETGHRGDRNQATVGAVGHRHRHPGRPPDTGRQVRAPVTCLPPQHRRPPRAGEVAPRARPGPAAMGSNRCRTESDRNDRIRLGTGHSRLRGVGNVGGCGLWNLQPDPARTRSVRSGRRFPASRSRWPATANC